MSDKNTMYDFIIVIELCQRELDSASLISSLLRQRGYSCEIVKFPFVHVSDLRRKYKNKVRVVLTQSLYANSTIENLVYSVFGKVKNIVDLRWEQLFRNSNSEDIDSYCYPKENAKEAYHLCWGEDIKQHMIRAGIQEDKLLLTGPIHMDFCRDIYSGLYPSRNELITKYNLSTDKKLLLFTSSFSYTTLTQDQSQSLQKIIGAEIVTEFIKISIDSKSVILSWFKKLLSDRDDIIIIYRPHPAEKNDIELRNIESSYKNFRVISDGSIILWIKAVDYIYNWYSTSIMEITSSGKVCQILRPIEFPFPMDVVTHNGLDFITDEKSFLQSIGDTSQSKFSEIQNKLRKYCDTDPDKQSVERFVNYLIQIIENINDRFSWNPALVKNCKKIQRRKLIRKFFFNSIEKIYNTLRCIGLRNRRLESHRDNVQNEIFKYESACEQIKNRIQIIDTYVRQRKIFTGTKNF